MTNYIIIENEEFALQHLKQAVGELRPSGYQLVGEFESVDDVVAWMQSHPQPDLIFMDIELVDGNCFDIFRRVRVTAPVIFTTAYDDYALQAFKVNSVDYLLKPIAPDALAQALEKFEQTRLQQTPQIDYGRLLHALDRQQASPRILIQSGDSYGYVNLSDVSYFLSEDKYVFLLTKQGQRRLTTYATLNEAEERLPRDQFFRVSRNVVASIDAIVGVHKFFTGRLSLVLRAGDREERIVVSAARRTAFLQWMGSGNV